jgi:putative addiction module component (TIGR02574 family)
MSTVKEMNIQSLSHSERIILAEELWDSIARNQNNLEVTDAQKELLDKRLEAYLASPEEGSSWNEIKDEM